jgi:nitrite reductase (NADH) small subunit
MPEHEVIGETEIPDGSCVVVTVEGVEVGIFKSKGRLFAYRNKCPHDGGPACRGTITGTLVQGPETDWRLCWDREGEILYCPWHGADFDITTGQALTRRPLRLQAYPLRVVDGTVRVTI